MTSSERFWGKVAKTEDVDGCWLWTGCKHEKGYGLFNRHDRAHRVSWELANGDIPRGLMVLHKCDNRGCVRPSHLFLGTNTDNMRDMAAKGRSLIGELNRNAKLTEAAVRSLKHEHRQSKVRHKDLAVKYGVNPTHVKAILAGRSWKHVK